MDSAENWSFDVDDLDSFSIVHDESGALTQGELVIHILEERLYMQAPGQNFETSHCKCLMPQSFQNRYRREIGYSSDMVWFELVDKQVDV